MPDTCDPETNGANDRFSWGSSFYRIIGSYDSSSRRRRRDGDAQTRGKHDKWTRPASPQMKINVLIRFRVFDRRLLARSSNNCSLRRAYTWMGLLFSFHDCPGRVPLINTRFTEPLSFTGIWFLKRYLGTLEGDFDSCETFKIRLS